MANSGGTKIEPRIDAWTNRQAIQIVAQLPDDAAEALAVLERAKWLLMCWRDAEEQTPVVVRVGVKG